MGDRSQVSINPHPPLPFESERRQRVAARRNRGELSRCMSDSRPIGVFDSGIGGLTVVKALRDLLPNENIFYLGDTARVPYGPKSPETVQRYAVELAGMLMQKNAKTLVMIPFLPAPTFRRAIRELSGFHPRLGSRRSESRSSSG